MLTGSLISKIRRLWCDVDSKREKLLKYPKKLVTFHININSLRNKFEILRSLLSELLDVLMITETKLDNSFPEQQFHIEGFNIPFRLDRNRHGGGLLLYVRNNINAVFLKSYVFPDNIEAFFIEILLKSCKWLICCSYNPNRINVATHLGEIGKASDTYSRTHEKRCWSAILMLNLMKRIWKHFAISISQNL